MLGFVARNRLVLIVTAVALALDQATKLAVIRTVDFGTSWPDTGFFRITHVGNKGSAFGLFGDQNSVLILASFLGVGILVYFYRAHPNPSPTIRAALGLMLAGALGNLIDRLINGHVTDFIDIGPWWIFNLADTSIVAGITGLAVAVLLLDGGRARVDADAAAASDSEEPVPALATPSPAGEQPANVGGEKRADDPNQP
jgi:signal peptidase II